MKRPIIYDDQIPLTLDLLDSSYFSQEAVALLLESVQRDSVGRRYGLEVTALSTPSMAVQISRGVATGLLAEDATPYGPRPASSATIVKLGYNPATTTLSNPSLPSGQNNSTVAVVAELVERDDDPQILPYYDPNSPGTAIPGGSAQNRRRICEIEFSFVYSAAVGADPLALLSDNQIPLAQFDMDLNTTSIRNSTDPNTQGSTPIIWFDDRRHIAPYAALPDQNTFTGDCTFTQDVEITGTADLDVGGRITAGSGITGTTLTASNDVVASNGISAGGNITSINGDITVATGNFVSGIDAANANHMVRLGQIIFRGAHNNTVEEGYIKIPAVTHQFGSPVSQDFILMWGKVEPNDNWSPITDLQGRQYGVVTDSYLITSGAFSSNPRIITAQVARRDDWYQAGTNYVPLNDSVRVQWVVDWDFTSGITFAASPPSATLMWWLIGY